MFRYPFFNCVFSRHKIPLKQIFTLPCLLKGYVRLFQRPPLCYFSASSLSFRPAPSWPSVFPVFLTASSWTLLPGALLVNRSIAQHAIDAGQFLGQTFLFLFQTLRFCLLCPPILQMAYRSPAFAVTADTASSPIPVLSSWISTSLAYPGMAKKTSAVQ